MAVWSKVQGLIAGTAIGGAAAAGVEPVLEPARQNAWWRRPFRVLLPEVAAAAYVRGIDKGVNYADDAKRSGVGAARFQVLAQLERSYPELAEVLHLHRRGRIDRDQAAGWLRYQGFSDTVTEDLLSLKDAWLSPEEVANAIQQGFLADPGILPPPPSGGPPWTPATEQVDLDATRQAAGAGTSPDELAVLVQLSGNPPGPETLLELWRRGIITEQAVDRGIREGRTKTKWTPALKRLFRPLLTPGTITNLRLRGWWTRDEANAELARHGYEPADGDHMFQAAGRPMAPVQAFTAYFRGAPSPTGAGDFTKADFVEAIRRSDVRPEYTEPLWGIRHAYPSLFQLRGAVQNGGITRARALQILRYERYEDQDATALVDSWVGGATQATRDLTAAEWAADFEGGYITELQYRTHLQQLGYAAELVDAKVALGDTRRVKRARDQRLARIHASFVGHKITQAEATAALQETQVRPDARAQLIAEWTAEREVNVAILTAAQVRSAYRKSIYTRARALAELAERGYNSEDANTFLDA